MINNEIVPNLIRANCHFLPHVQPCLSCADRELFKNFTREEVKEKILRKLGMIAPPNVTTEAVPEHLLNRLLNR